ncbi:hypothetical protein [Pedobacter alpinus]|uniref:Uncharacterized protein n=1 Tax=Pedobacter alpinus TaxID=1590643 RepID=A0ABW5TS54_9SPHI
MFIKSIVITLAICLGSYFAQSQENKILLSFSNQTTKTIKKGDYVRLAYPSNKLEIKKAGKMPEFLGFRGRVDSIAENQIWLKVDKRTNKQKSFTIADITAIKKVSKSAELLTFIGSFAIIGTSAVLITNSLDISPALTAFSGAFALFPAAILTANLFYPTKPSHKIGDGYTLKVITIN